MLVNRENLTLVFRGFNARLFRSLEETPSFKDKLATIVPSSTETEDYGWLQQLPSVTEWIGDKAIKALAASDYSIKNKEWEDTIEVKRKDIQDDRFGVYNPMIDMLGIAAKQHPDYLLAALISAGFATVCYDGQYMFDTDHPLADGTTWSNKVTTAFSAAAYAAARIAIATVKGEQGRYLNVEGTLLVGHPTLEESFRQVTKAARRGESTSATSVDNIWKGTADYILLPHLATTTEWYLLDVSKPIKPFIFQDREAIHPVQQTNPDAEGVFKRGKFLYGTEARYNVGYGLPQLGYGSTGGG